jgi:hypothetical protein
MGCGIWTFFHKIMSSVSIFSLWLNEGFARYMEGIGAQHVQINDTGLLDRVVTEVTMTVMDKG